MTKKLIVKIREALKLWIKGVIEKEKKDYEAADQFGIFGHFVRGLVQGFKSGFLIFGCICYIYALIIAKIKGKELKVSMVDKPKK